MTGIIGNKMIPQDKGSCRVTSVNCESINYTTINVFSTEGEVKV